MAQIGLSAPVLLKIEKEGQKIFVFARLVDRLRSKVINSEIYLQ